MAGASSVRMNEDGSHEGYEWGKGWRPATSWEQRCHYQDQGMNPVQQQRFVAQSIRDGRTIRKNEQEQER